MNIMEVKEWFEDLSGNDDHCSYSLDQCDMDRIRWLIEIVEDKERDVIRHLREQGF